LTPIRKETKPRSREDPEERRPVMAQTFEDRVEEVLGLLQGMAWPLLEEADKRRVVGKVAKGIDRGDALRAWGRALGVPESTLRARLDHFRSQEPIDGARPRIDAETKRKKLWAARSVLQDPQLVDELVEDRATRRALSDAAQRHQDAIESEVKADSKKRAPELHHRMGWNEVAGDLLRVRQLFGRALEAAKELKLDPEETAAFRDDLKAIAAIGEWFESFLDSGNADFDTELERLLEG
jgi:Family of unknown function (DUF6192)